MTRNLKGYNSWESKGIITGNLKKMAGNLKVSLHLFKRIISGNLM